MVTAQFQGGSGARGLRTVDRIVVTALALALPVHFRARQRGEWTADLSVLSTPARRRYLLGAALTLPTLHALARRVPTDGPQDVVRLASPSVQLIARVLIFSLGWTVLAWLVMLPARYLIFDIPSRLAAASPAGDSHSVWPADHGYGVLLPLIEMLYWGALAAATDAPFILVLALVAAVAVALQSRKPWQHRLRLAFVRVAFIVMIALMLASIDVFFALMITGGGPALPLTGLVGAGLGALGHDLSKSSRILVGVLGLAAVAIAVIDNTVGLNMVVWFRD